MTRITRASSELLRTALRSALVGVGIESPIRSLRRSENVYESSHLSEIVDCTLQSGPLPPILCKCGPSHERDSFGLRHGLAYEADVYRHVLRNRYPAPRFYGSYDDPDGGLTWLFLEYLGEGWQLDLGPETAIVDAAAIMGAFHRRPAPKVASDAASTLNRHDEAYFRSCLCQASLAAAGWRERVASFDHLVRRFEAGIELLVSAPRTVVHGEFTPHNVVWAHERPYVVDWEHAALGAGEVDLAGLTDDWDEDLVELATAAYLRKRWPRQPPDDFAATLEAARLYWLFRWLGSPEEAGTEEEIAWIVERANAAAAANGA